MKKFIKKWFTLFELLIVIWIIWIFTTAVISFQFYMFNKNNENQAFELLARNQTTLSQVVNQYFKEIDRVIFYYSPSTWLEYPSSDTFTFNWRTWSYTDFSANWDNWQGCKRFDTQNYDIIWFTVKGSIQPIVIWIETKIKNVPNKNMNWTTPVAIKNFAIYKFPTTDIANKKNIPYINTNTNRLDASLTFDNTIHSSMNKTWDEYCNEYTTGLFSEFRADKDNYFNPNIKIPKHWFRIFVPETIWYNPKVWIVSYYLIQQVNYSSPNKQSLLYTNSYSFSLWN